MNPQANPRRVVPRRKPLPGTVQKYRKVATIRVKNPGVSLREAVELAEIPQKSFAQQLYGNPAYQQVEDSIRAKKEAAFQKHGIDFDFLASNAKRLVEAKKTVPVVLKTYGVSERGSYIDGERLEMVEVEDNNANVNAVKLIADMIGATSASQKFIQNNTTVNNTQVNISETLNIIHQLPSLAKARYMDDYRKAMRLNEPAPSPRDYLEGEFTHE